MEFTDLYYCYKTQTHSADVCSYSLFLSTNSRPSDSSYAITLKLPNLCTLRERRHQSVNPVFLLWKSSIFEFPIGLLFSFMLTQHSKAARPPGELRPIQFVVILISSEDKSSPSYLLLFSVVYHKVWGTRWRSWSRQSATSRHVAGSCLDGIIGIFH
jgi:hypothetical protein